MNNPFNFNPRKWPFFYGYIILVVGAIGATMSAPGQTIGVSVFTDHLLEAFSIDRIELSWTYLLGTITSAFLLTFGGRMYDRYGARVMAPVAGGGLALSLLLLTRVAVFSEAISSFSSISATVLTLILLAIGFLGIRFFGQGLLTMVSKNMVMKWFDTKRGLASAIYGIALVMGFSVVPKLYSVSIEKYNWQFTWELTAMILGIGFTLFALFFYRDNPLDFGLQADGGFSKSSKKKKKKSKLVATGKDFELKDAIKTYSFWVFALSLTLFAFFLTALTFHIEDIFVTSGFSKEKAISIFIPTAFFAVGIKLSVGFITDYIKLKYILLLELLGLFISAMGVVLLKFGDTTWLVIVGNSLAQGVFGILSAVAWPRFFGLKNLGAISGFATSWIVAGSAVGPLVFSYSKEYTGNYHLALIICGILAGILFLLALKADNASETKTQES